MLKSQHILTSYFPLSLSQSHTHNNHFLSPSLSSNLNFHHRPNTLFSVPSQPRAIRPFPWLSQVSEPNSTSTITEKTEQEEGPIELFQSTSPIFATNDEPSFIQVATSVLLTGAISVFLFRSLRRRAKRVKESVTIYSNTIAFMLKFWILETGFGILFDLIPGLWALVI